MYSVHLKVALISPREDLFRAVRAETATAKVHLTWKRNFDHAIKEVGLSSIDAILLESDDLGDIADLKIYVPNVPVILLHRELNQQLGLAAIREGASEFLATDEMGSGSLFRTIRYCVERGKVEQALEVSRSQLLTSQKMEAIGRTVSGVAHDFRHFLQVIYGNCGLMKRLNEDSTIDEMIDEIRVAAEKANLTIKHLLSFAQGSPVRETLTEVNKVILDLNPMFKALLGTGLSIEYSLCSQPLLARLDSRIEQVLMNLVVNAADAMAGKRGTIFIESRPLSLERPYYGPDVRLASGQYSVIEISDNGTGIEPDVIDRIFEPFFTTKPREVGTGIGLSVVFTLVQDWRGKVVVASRPGVGTTFKLIFPSEHCGKSLPSARQEKLNLAVTLCESDKALQLLLRRDLSVLGCEVTEVDGQQPTLALDGSSPSAGIYISQMSPKIMFSAKTKNETDIGLSTPFSRQELERNIVALKSV